jgi:hypothetical protein
VQLLIAFVAINISMGYGIKHKSQRESQTAADLPSSRVHTTDEDDEESEVEIPAKDPNLKTPNTDRHDTEESDHHDDDDDDEG